MYFNSAIFLIFFLPIVIILYAIADQKRKNLVILVSSVLFFCWNQIFYLPLMLAVILGNYYLGMAIERASNPAKKRLLLFSGSGVNLLLLLFFKIIAGYGGKWVAGWFLQGVVTILNQYLLPLGFSYIIFQLISYQVDVYKGICESEKSLYAFSIYVMAFPKILVGPIVRYRDLHGQIKSRESNSQDIVDGLRRFIQGLIKKTLIADTIAHTINPAFTLATPNFSTPIAWFVLIGYALQLYFDFSGYTDMAIGLGKMMGFQFVENFNYPYISKSIADFWRRWHISLATWFREYVFYPLERSRRKFKFLIQPFNFMIVFVLVGLWHGISLNFIVWGGLHGMAMAIESTGFGGWLKKAWIPLQHLYTLVVVLIGWIFFRSPTLTFAAGFLARLIGLGKGITPLPFSVTKPLPFIDPSVWLAFMAAVFFTLPIAPGIRKYWERAIEKNSVLRGLGRVGVDLFLFGLLVLSFAAIISRATVITSVYAKF